MMEFLVAGLATWRLCSLLLYEEGPGHIFVYVRTFAQRWAWSTQLFSCVYCLSVWVGLICAVLLFTSYWWLMLPLALSAVAVVVAKCLEQLSTSQTHI